MAYNKNELIQKIKSIELLSKEEKAALIELLRSNKKYGLVWENKPEEVEEHLRTEIPVLKEVKERAILSDSPEAPNHILIEGDNLEALVALTYTHAGKIDIIYIDPPYNRGEKDFLYNDNYIDKDNPFKHSIWLSFIYKRLSIAKTLLSDRGVLIIHIDEHEFDALHLLLETELFGSSRNLGLIIWNKMNPKGDAQSTATMHEYILLFCKNREVFIQNENNMLRHKANAEQIISKGKSLISKIGKKDVPDDLKYLLKSYKYPKHIMDHLKIKYDYSIVCQEFQSWLIKQNFSKGEKAYKYIDKDGNVFRTVSMAWPNKDKAPDDYWIPLAHPETGEICPLPSRGWRNPSSTMAKLLGDGSVEHYCGLTISGEIAFSKKKDGTNNIPERIYYLQENMMENIPSIYNDGSSDDQLLSDIGVSFPYPKAISVAKYLLNNICRLKDALILDFFAGSGTTLHATMMLNAEDGGNRQCILVTNNENKICEEVTYERNKRVIQGYTTSKGVQVEGLRSNSLRYYKTDFVGREQTPRNMRALMSASVELLCIKNDLYVESDYFVGKKLNKKITRYFDDGKKKMLIVFNEEAIPYIAEEISRMDYSGKMLVYVFSPGNYAFEDDFAEVIDKIELCAIPSAIYNAYQKVLPKKRVDVVFEDSEENENSKEA
ncbi:MAG: site-specific DNA-methyltransferase [Bacteroidales bacterium]|nr:site-specific DNA-methyltransferase [Bacteroidales bacterium]